MPESKDLKTYHGSCHCGTITYLFKLRLPPTTDPNIREGLNRIYKCNCTVCHKMGFFHCRPIDPAADFILTSPSTIEEMGRYSLKGIVEWYFCRKCGVHVLGLGGSWKQEDVDVDEWAGKEGGSGKKQKVWVTRPKGERQEKDKEGKEFVKPFHYVSVNATTLDHGQEGLDLREWHEKGWIFYVECWKRKEGEGSKERFGTPHECGMY
ncbi:uncharacterized protein EI97DRAFT_437294 [Westerdykella ornata]|uniref:CENP-V/GFA domain-containing protein n=1 Tax=Westerdykella ornata TaxID=318751 RepID=A0A6A6J9X6_WESOR|nr:uncharacterized protein EI97DRAFT_437294 [Westerdykella ornata]KAF2272009.1 hypothetical protein EI97DRAFT_437294 [Westerdykella ornata]